MTKATHLKEIEPRKLNKMEKLNDCLLGRTLIAQDLNGAIKYFPKRISDFFYNIFSNYRKNIIKGNCQIPDNHIREKFIL
tara:strand:- start:300 stop:539 length:240 start_codon:yes stop_codon:yes gene_type:complete